jgi:hypothetical protein
MTMGSNPEQLYKEREQRVNDAIQLNVPDRIPFFPSINYFAAKRAGITLQEAWYNADKWFGASKDVALDLEPDLVWPSRFSIFSSGQAFEAIDFKQIKWPGHGISPNYSHQFVEAEYMTAEEYDAFLSDPSDFAVRTYLPRLCGSLEPLTNLPPLQLILFGFAWVGMTALLTTPEMNDAFKSLYKAGLESVKWMGATHAFEQEMHELGFPMSAQSVALVPFDLISDMLRGMRGAMLDMFRHPDKLQEAMERLYPQVLGFATVGAQASGNPRIFIPLHRGADGFMSLEQFETFYWPFLKRLILDLVDAGLTPCPFFEGSYDQRLHYLNELPRGKVLGMFDRTDVFKAKEVIGDTMCISGNVPSSLLQSGTPQQVKDYCKKLIDIVGEGGGFIMGSATVMDDAAPELVKVWKEFTREYGVYT